MKTNAEIRAEAWKVVRGKWFWRIFTAGSLLYFIALAVGAALVAVYSDMGIQTWSDFLKAKLEAQQSGLGYTVPSVRVFWKMTGASAFQQFMACVFGSIVLFGLAGLMLRAVRDDAQGWFAGSFGGFKRPLELTWLMVLMNLRIFLWGLLFVLPGIVALYRYRQAWYLKSEHPDWGAGKCLTESGMMMRGRKGQAFRLDVSFCGWMLLAWLVFAGASVGLAMEGAGASVLAFVGALAGIVGFYFFAFVLAYFFVARAIFYRELTATA